MEWEDPNIAKKNRILNHAWKQLLVLSPSLTITQAMNLVEHDYIGPLGDTIATQMIKEHR